MKLHIHHSPKPDTITLRPKHVLVHKTKFTLGFKKRNDIFQLSKYLKRDFDFERTLEYNKKQKTWNVVVWLVRDLSLKGYTVFIDR